MFLVCPGLFLIGKTQYKYIESETNDRHFPDDIFKHIFLSDFFLILMISLLFVSQGPINNIPASVKKMAWCQSGDKSLSEPMVIIALTHICVTRPRRVQIILLPSDTLNIANTQANARLSPK